MSSHEKTEDDQMSNWLKRLESLPILELPLDFPRPPVPGYLRSTETLVVGADHWQALRDFCESEGTNAATAVVTIANVLLSRYSGQNDLVLGTVGRLADAENGEGEPNLVALRTSLEGQPCVRECLSRVRQTARAAGENQNVPFDDVVEALGADEEFNRAPVFQVLVVPLGMPGLLDDTAVTAEELDELTAATNRCDLVITAAADDAGLTVACEYNGELFEAATITRLLGHWRAILEELPVDASRPMAALPMLTSDETQQIVRDWNATDREYGDTWTLHGKFEQQAAATPDAVAIEFAGETLTYRELNERANQLARELQAHGVTAETYVGVYMERSLELVISLYGVIKAGGAYVPLDPEYPHDRVTFMIEDAACPVLLTQQRLVEQIPDNAAAVIALDAEWDRIATQDAANLSDTVTGENLAYMIYTSGSTGRPKGVMNEHRAICNRLDWMQEAFPLTAEDRVLQKTPYSFDVSVWEFFWPLLVGARLVVAKPGGHKDSAYLVQEICQRRITTMHFVPSMLQAFLEDEGVEECRCLKRVICSGEALPYPLQKRFFARSEAELHNLYGPTEAAVDVTWWPCQRDDSSTTVPIGRAIANTQIYILNEQMQPVPGGVPGELHIGGVQVARGYLNRPELTAEKFVADPFSDAPGARLYKTGDLARFLDDGVVEYLDRIDNQVKIRGFRIELGEIEAVLLRHDAVRECAVVVRNDAADEKRIVAYIVPASSPAPTTTQLREYLQDVLPDYMVPAHFVPMDVLPLTPSGKTDRKALPEVDQHRPELDAAYVMPQSEIETRLASLWQELLQIDDVGVQDNFFDLGGHSLLLARMRTELREQFDRNVAMVELFQYPTIAALASFLSAETQHASAASTVAEADSQRQGTDDIAVIGMAGRFPGAKNVDEYWSNLENGVESVTFFSDEELLDAGIDPELVANPHYVKASAVLRDVDQFDASFFGYSPREATLLDPQQRFFLECAWEAMENTGYYGDACDMPVGVYAGVGMNTYVLDNLNVMRKSLGDVGAFQLMIGNDKDFMPTRIAYKLNLKGPGVNVQTACSTSLVAIHMACRGILDGDCRMALAGGVSIRLPHIVGYLHEEGMIYSPDGHCRTFDAQAQGTVFGSGAGVVVLKRLDDAIADGDCIHAVIKGSAINNDGAEKIGYTTPSVDGQANVIAKAQRVAGVTPDTVTYVEAHGTATPLGDPVEMTALTKAFRAGTDKSGFCGIGSVKSNIGHIDAAAGVAGFMKVVLALENKTLPPSLHYTEPNPQIDFESSPFWVVQKATPWAEAPQPRRAGVSSFGIGGTNCHIVVEEAPLVEPSSSSASGAGGLLTLSARDAVALGELATRYASHLPSEPESAANDVCFTANAGRADFEHRVAVQGESLAEITQRLQKFAAGKRAPGVVSGQASERFVRVALLFTGQGAQYIGMGRELFETYAVFRETIEQCDAILRDCSDVQLIQAIYEAEEDSTQLNETAYTQPALFALEYALWKLWQSWGIEASAVLGHSVGEYVAACVAGVFSLEDGLALIAERGRLMQALPRDGQMASVFASEEVVAAAIGGNDESVSIATLNGPQQVVISGRSEAVETVLEKLAAEGIEHHRLSVSHAFHSALMDPMLDEFEAFAATKRFASPQLELISNVSGQFAGEEVSTARYWRDHVRGAVRFREGVSALADAGYDLFLELGPHPVLSGLGQACVDASGASWLPSLRRGQGDVETLLRSLGELYVRGVPVDWQAVHGPAQRRPLPNYPFQRQRYWHEPDEQQPAAGKHSDDGLRHPLLGEQLRLPLSKEVRFENEASRYSPPYVNDHRVFGTLIVPGASHVSMFLTGPKHAFGLDRCELRELFFVKPFTLSETGSRTCQLIYEPREDGTHLFTLTSLEEGGRADDPSSWVVHASGTLLPDEPKPANADGESLDLTAIRARCTDHGKGDDFYRDVWVQGDDAGPSFRWIDEIWEGDDEAICSLRRPEIDDDTDPYQIYPGIIEAVFQAMRCGREFESQRLLKENGIIYVPFSLAKIRFFGQPTSDNLLCYAKVRNDQGQDNLSVVGDLWLADESGRVIAEFEGFEVRKLTRETLSPSLQNRRQHWYHDVAWTLSKETNTARDGEPNWLVFAEESSVTAGLSEHVAQAGGQMVLVESATDVDTVREAVNGHAQLTDILYICPAAPNDQGDRTAEQLQADIRRSGEGLLHLVQAISQANRATPPRLWVITSGVHNVGDEVETVCLEHAPLWGFGRVIASEHPELRCTLVDIARNGVDAGAVFEAITHSDNETQIGIRASGRYVARLKRRAVQTMPTVGEIPISGDGCYLITGGLGELGLRCASWLAEHGARHVALLGRRGPTEKAQRAIDVLKESGVNVSVLAADISSRDSLAAALEQLSVASVPLRGIIHAAGALDDGVIEQQNWSRFETALAPKVAGTWHLHELTANEPLDFFINFSSATSILGMAGQSNYGAANSFMDAFAIFRRALGKPALTVNWGPWSEVGMAARQADVMKRRMEDHGWGWIDPDSGMKVMEDLLTRGISNSVVLPITWGRYLEKSPDGGTLPFFAELRKLDGAKAQIAKKASKPTVDILKRLNSTPPNRRQQLLMQFVHDLVVSILALDGDDASVDPQHGFTEMGMDSLMGIELRRNLQDQLKVSLASTFSFDHPNIEAVTEFLLGQLYAAEEEVSSIPDKAATVADDLSEEDFDASLEDELAKLEASLKRDSGQS